MSRTIARLFFFGIYFSCTVHAFTQQKKPWTFLVYMAAANDLYLFADRNLEQMKQVGSSHLVNILVHLDILKPNTPKVTKRLVIHKNRIEQIGTDLCMDSGDEATLLDTLRWAQRDYESEHLAFVFWNHGSGDLNPVVGKSINPSQLFYYNPTSRLIELDRSIGFLEFVDHMVMQQKEQRGVCFDESKGTYLNDQKIKRALSTFCAERNKKIDVILFDACLMAGIGTAWLVHPYAHYMVASEEVALGPGYDYALVLLGLTAQQATPRLFAQHVVASYEKIYQKITQDYTQSAIDLSYVQQLSDNIHVVAQLLLQALKLQRNNSVKNNIRQSMMCVVFDEPSYRDLGSFYNKLLTHLKHFQFVHDKEGAALMKNLDLTLRHGLKILSHAVIANAVGRRVKEASGIYLYFPSKRIHSSYAMTEFAKTHAWKEFLETFLTMQ